jgi:3-oxoacyl-[acyl-carrier-protein] synthase II
MDDETGKRSRSRPKEDGTRLTQPGLPILGVGPVTALGSGIDSLREGLQGTRRPPIEQEEVEVCAGGASLPVYRARVEGLDSFVPKRALRRLDRFSRMALLAACLAREDAGIGFTDSSRVGLVFGSAYGPLGATFAFQDSAIDDGDKCASPTSFANSVHNALASQVSIAMGIEGPCFTVTSFGLTVAGVFSTARMWLAGDVADYVLAGVGEEYSPVVGYAAAQKARVSHSSLQPFCFDRCTYAPGEGFVVFLLGKKAESKKYGALQRIDSFRLGANGAFPDQSRGQLDALFLAANGDARTGKAYRRALSPRAPHAAYSVLYGSMPTGVAFDAAIAAASIQDRTLYPTPDSRVAGGVSLLEREQHLPENARIGCLACDADGYGTFLLVSG